MTEYTDEVVTRSAPRWAWDLIDETLAMDSKSGSFDPELRQEIHAALEAMVMASASDADTLKRSEITAQEQEAEERRILVAIEGGLVTAVCTDDKSLRDLSVAVIDYDTEGADPEDVHTIPQSRGEPAECLGHIESIQQCNLDMDAVFDALSGRDFRERERPTRSNIQSGGEAT